MHAPVLLKEVVDLMAIKKGGIYVDATAGSGGHAQAILERVGSDGRLLAMDRDADAVRRVDARLSGWGNCCVVKADYADMCEVAVAQGVSSVDGVLIDCGVSSEQLDSPERGFSFMAEGLLDMRMDRDRGPTAEDLVNDLEQDELEKIFRELGEERAGRRIARAIVYGRGRKRIRTTTELAEIVSRSVGGRRGRLHPATRVFQALRIAVNNELTSLQRGVDAAISMLSPLGRVAVISFHSLEDRLVKRTFARHVGRWESLPAGGSEWQGERPQVSLVTRKPVTAGDEEVYANPRARSAKLRVAERRADNEEMEAA